MNITLIIILTVVATAIVCGLLGRRIVHERVVEQVEATRKECEAGVTDKPLSAQDVANVFAAANHGEVPMHADDRRRGMLVSIDGGRNYFLSCVNDDDPIRGLVVAPTDIPFRHRYEFQRDIGTSTRSFRSFYVTVSFTFDFGRYTHNDFHIDIIECSVNRTIADVLDKEIRKVGIEALDKQHLKELMTSNVKEHLKHCGCSLRYLGLSTFNNTVFIQGAG